MVIIGPKKRNIFTQIRNFGREKLKETLKEIKKSRRSWSHKAGSYFGSGDERFKKTLMVA